MKLAASLEQPKFLNSQKQSANGDGIVPSAIGKKQARRLIGRRACLVCYLTLGT